MGKPKPVQHVWQMHRSLMGTEWNSQWSWCGWNCRHGWKRAHRLPDPAPASNGRTRHGRKGGSWRCMEMLYGGMTSTLRSTDCSMHMLIWSSSIKHACTNGAFGSPPCSSMESTGVDDVEHCSCKRCVSGIGVLQSKDSSIQARKRNTRTSGSFGAVRELFWNLYRWVVVVVGLRSIRLISSYEAADTAPPTVGPRTPATGTWSR